VTTDAYIEYTHRFFEKWLPVYDLFAWPIGFVYRAAVERVGPRPGRRVLDLCTGTGEVALRLARRGAEVTGVDITEAMLAKARRKAERKQLSPAPRFELMDARHLALRMTASTSPSISLALHDMPRRVRLEVLREALRVSRERVVVLDYELPPGRPRGGS